MTKEYELGVVDESTAFSMQNKGVNDPWIVRRLLRDGHRIVDIKPRLHNTHLTRFIFAYDHTLHDDLMKYLKERRANHEGGDLT